MALRFKQEEEQVDPSPKKRRFAVVSDEERQAAAQATVDIQEEAVEKLRALENVEDFLIATTRIDPLRLQDEFVSLPAVLAYWNQRYAESYERLQRAKVCEKRTRSILRIRKRQELLMSGVRVTESQVESAVDEAPEMVEAELDLIRAEAEKVRIQGACEAVRTKRDMVISIGAHVRAEMQGDPSLRRLSSERRVYDGETAESQGQ